MDEERNSVQDVSDFFYDKYVLESGDQAPGDGEPYVCSVVNLARQTVPAIDEDSALGSLYGLGIVDRLPGNLGEGVASHHLSALHGTEAILLAVAAIPDPVPEEVGSEHGYKERLVPAVLGGGVVGQVDGAMAVGQGNTSKVPEDEHEPPLLVVDVPGGDDELLTFGTGIGVEVVSHNEEPDFAGNVAVPLPLTSSGAETENEEEVPRHADLAEHLEIQNAKHAGVQLGTHEKVINGIARHAMLFATVQSREVGNEAD